MADTSVAGQQVRGNDDVYGGQRYWNLMHVLCEGQDPLEALSSRPATVMPGPNAPQCNHTEQIRGSWEQRVRRRVCYL